ncbi:MAG: hypothetical protein JWQ14_327 [Adhaeribacter sp.]|nr:hypothetical protein [Adhaeribacter sp.]
MKKITLLLFVSFFGFICLPAQAQDNDRAININAGIGLGVYNAGGIPLGASVEVGIKNNIAVGGFIDYVNYNRKFNGFKWKYNFLYFGGRASYHLGDLFAALGMANEKLDPYAGLSLGLRTVSYKENDNYQNYVSPYKTHVFVGGHLGARYFFTHNIGGFAEVGYGVSALRLGLAVKF